MVEFWKNGFDKIMSMVGKKCLEFHYINLVKFAVSNELTKVLFDEFVNSFVLNELTRVSLLIRTLWTCESLLKEKSNKLSNVSLIRFLFIFFFNSEINSFVKTRFCKNSLIRSLIHFGSNSQINSFWPFILN